MGWLTCHICVSTVLSIGSLVTLSSAVYIPSYCSTDTVSCSSQLLHLNVPDSACSVISPLSSSSDCAKWTFNMNGVSPELGSVTLKIFPLKVPGWEFSVFNVTFTDIKWTSLRLRFSQNGYDNKTFCREFNVSSDYYIRELFYDCVWTQSNYEGTPFTFEYEAASMHRTEARRYVTNLPFYKDIESNTPLKNWTTLLYVDTTELPFLTARWQQVPSRFGVQNYSVKVFKKVEGSEMSLEVSEVVHGTDDDRELTYNFDGFLVSGVCHFEVGVLNDSCPNGLCRVSSSPDIPLRDFGTKTLLFSIVGCLIFISACLSVWMWQRHLQPKREEFKLPVVLIIYTPSQAAHIKCVVTLTEYLRNHCSVEALLDQLDILYTEKQDPFVWCNEAFSRADFVMMVSSPPKCCNQEGIFRNLDVLALHFLKERFSKPSSRPQFFSVLMPYCTEKDIPDEAKNLRVFKLMKDFDKMLWYIHNGGRFRNTVDYAKSLLDPKPVGGKSYWQERGKALQVALREAEDDLCQVCNCKKQNIKQNGDDDVENARFLTTLMRSGEEGNECGRKVCDSVSTDHLVLIPKPLDVEIPFLLDDLDLTGAGELDVKPKNNAATLDLGFDLSAMKL